MKTQAGAERSVLIAALIVFGVYFYRHLSEGTSNIPTYSQCGIPQPKGQVTRVAQFVGFGTPANMGAFITAWGFVFFSLSVLASFAPGLASSFSILFVAGDLLGNGCQLFHDVSYKVGSTGGAAGKQTPTSGVTTNPISASGGNAPNTGFSGTAG